MNNLDYCKVVAKEAADKIWDFQQAITGPVELSESLTNEDIETLDAARIILDKYTGAYSEDAEELPEDYIDELPEE